MMIIYIRKTKWKRWKEMLEEGRGSYKIQRWSIEYSPSTESPITSGRRRRNRRSWTGAHPNGPFGDFFKKLPPYRIPPFLRLRLRLPRRKFDLTPSRFGRNRVIRTLELWRKGKYAVVVRGRKVGRRRRRIPMSIRRFWKASWIWRVRLWPCVE